jgi:VIT1/CCC1 family predicted Fe2+/Mn2+ transporter
MREKGRHMENQTRLGAATKRTIIAMQVNEVTESIIYAKVAKRVADPHNKDILLKISAEEKRHADIWKRYTGMEAQPKRFKILWFTLLGRIFGFTFALKLMERGEGDANEIYESIASEVPEAKKIAQDEDRHEQELLALLDEERLQYVGSMVLGLSDALVELSGTLAGLTFAMQNTRLIALSGLITGISATLSMASSEYLSSRSEGNTNALKSGLYTGVVYLVTVGFLVLPYLLMPNDSFMWALAIMLGTVVLIILGFTYYISVAKDLPFLKRFGEMAGISLTVAAISFVIGIIVKATLGIEI